MRTDRKADILEAFIRLVSHFGVDKTTMQDVAKETGLSIGTIYSDFKNKEDLIEAYIDSMGHKIINRYRQILDEKLPTEELLHRFIIGIFENSYKIVQEDRGLCQFLQGSETIKVLQKNYAKRQDLTEEIAKMIETIMIRGVREGIFSITNIPKVSRLFLCAFEAYWKDLFMSRDPKGTFQGIEDMYTFLMGAIRNRNCNLESKVM